MYIYIFVHIYIYSKQTIKFHDQFLNILICNPTLEWGRLKSLKCSKAPAKSLSTGSDFCILVVANWLWLGQHIPIFWQQTEPALK